MIQVELPGHLRDLARIEGDVVLDVDGPVTQRTLLDALEARYPALRGSIRMHGTLKRRPYVRYYACLQDLSHDDPDQPLPEPVAEGREPFIVLGAISGG